jgi:tetratricopeptide (TPR) repeat protein
MSLSEIGRTYGFLKDYKNAIKSLKRGLKIAEELYGDHPHTITARILENLKDLYTELKFPKDALYYEKKYQEQISKLPNPP